MYAMKNLLKIIVLQIFWYIAVYFGHLYQLSIFVSSFVLVALNYALYKPNISLKNYLIFLSSFICYGFFQEWLFQKLGLVNYHQTNFPLWLTSLWVVFVCYYGDIFNYMYKIKPIFLTFMGGFGGVLAFYGGAKISLLEALSPWYYVGIFISWAVFFPLSLKLFKKLRREDK